MDVCRKVDNDRLRYSISPASRFPPPSSANQDSPLFPFNHPCHPKARGGIVIILKLLIRGSVIDGPTLVSGSKSSNSNAPVSNASDAARMISLVEPWQLHQGDHEKLGRRIMGPGQDGAHVRQIVWNRSSRGILVRYENRSSSRFLVPHP